MARWYYTVIVGTQPGVYGDWTQAAPKVIEISGAIHKKFRTLREAWEAYNKAAREGALRVVRVDPEPDAESPVGSPGREEGLIHCPVARRTIHSTTGLGHYTHRRNRSKGVEIMSSMQAGPSHCAERMGHVIIDTEPREHHSFGQQSRPPDGSQALRPTGTSYRGHSNESRQESLHRPVRPIPSSSRAVSCSGVAHEEARSVSALTERRRRVSESPSAAHSRSPQSTSRVTRRVMRSPQVEDKRRFPGNVVRQHGHGRPPSAPPLADGHQNDIGPQSSDGFSFYLQSPPANAFLNLEPPRASGSQGPLTRRASVQSPDTYPDSFSFDCSAIQSRAPSPQTGMEMGGSLGPPGSLPRSPARSCISLTSSNETSSVFSFNVNFAVVETPGSPGRSAHVASLPASPPTIPPFAVLSPVENAIAGPSTQSQEGSNEEENEDGSQASSDDTEFETVCDAEDLLERMNSPQMDRSIPSLSRPLSPLIVASTSRSLTSLTQSIHPSGIDTTTLSSPLVWPWWSPSLSPYVDPESSRSTEATGLGLSIEGTISPSPHSHPPQHRTTTRAPSGSLPHRLAQRIEGQSSTGPDPSPRDASASRAPASPLHLASVVSDLTYQSEGARSMNSVVPSPRNVRLPSSPSTSTPRSSPARLQAQPSHRASPLMPFYPSLAIGDAPSTPPSRLHIDFDRPTPRLSPSHITVVPAPTASRTPSADPRSPLSRLARIPGSIMEISRYLFFGRPTPPRSDSDARIL